jgi:p-aminobenzoyl-glutamate transporter AbgT
MIGFMQKYSTDSDRPYNVIDTLKVTLPITLIIGLVWIAILVLWFISGLPIGINGFSTL